MWGSLMWEITFIKRLSDGDEGINKMTASVEKTQLSNQLDALKEKFKAIFALIDKKRRPKYREELEELEKEVDTWKVEPNDKNALKARWNKILEKLGDMVE
eukprot:Platyproteum_vivax@DN7625_c1_g1_i3.p1